MILFAKFYSTSIFQTVKMQEGSIRCDVNVSVRKRGVQNSNPLRNENVNSFSATMRAIEYEANRQIEVLEAGGEIVQETRRWDDTKGQNFVLRSKEDAHDYRYFPEPDLLTIVLDEEYVNELKAGLPELPNVKLARYMKELGLPRTDAELLVDSVEKSKLFEETLSLGKCQAKNICNWILGDISKYLNDGNHQLSDTALTPENLAELIENIEKGIISNTAGKTVLDVIIAENKKVSDIISEKGLAQISDTSALEKTVKEILAANQKSVADYKGGKTNAFGFLVGQCMKATKGKGNPGIIRDLITKYLNQ